MLNDAPGFGPFDSCMSEALTMSSVDMLGVALRTALVLSDVICRQLRLPLLFTHDEPVTNAVSKAAAAAAYVQ